MRVDLLGRQRLDELAADQETAVLGRLTALDADEVRRPAARRRWQAQDQTGARAETLTDVQADAARGQVHHLAAGQVARRQAEHLPERVQPPRVANKGAALEGLDPVGEV